MIRTLMFPSLIFFSGLSASALDQLDSGIDSFFPEQQFFVLDPSLSDDGNLEKYVKFKEIDLHPKNPTPTWILKNIVTREATFYNYETRCVETLRDNVSKSFLLNFEEDPTLSITYPITRRFTKLLPYCSTMPENNQLILHVLDSSGNIQPNNNFHCPISLESFTQIAKEVTGYNAANPLASEYFLGRSREGYFSESSYELRIVTGTLKKVEPIYKKRLLEKAEAEMVKNSEKDPEILKYITVHNREKAMRYGFPLDPTTGEISHVSFYLNMRKTKLTHDLEFIPDWKVNL